MDDDEDDFYGSGEQNGQRDHEMSGQDPIKNEDHDMSEEEEEDSDDDVQFTLEKPETIKTEAPTTRAASKAIPVESSESKLAKSTPQPATVKQESAEPQNTRNELLHDGKEGKDFPEHRTSDVNLEDDPTWPANGKQITELDIDADLAEHSKPWRLPGTDVTDYFNYGFDEYTWTQYCAKQRSMAGTIGELKDQDAQMKSMLGGMPNMEGGGMPDMNAMMQMMMGGGGMGPDPSKMDFGQMMSMMGGMPPPGPGFNGQGGFPGPQGGNSPLPQSGQGFQPPLGPSSMQSQMDGFNPGMMQQDQQAPQQQQQQGGHGGQGGGRGRGRRGRGYY